MPRMPAMSHNGTLECARQPCVGAARSSPQCRPQGSRMPSTSRKRSTQISIWKAAPSLRQRSRALLLLVAFVGGGLISPAVHYGFMAISGLWDSPAHSGHMGASTAVAHAHQTAATDPGGTVRDTQDAPLACHYADLFATFAATFGVQDAVSPSVHVATALQAPVEDPDYQYLASSRSRAPPALA